jgi:hypothetical protein
MSRRLLERNFGQAGDRRLACDGYQYPREHRRPMIIELARGLYALCHPYAVGEPVTTHGAGSTGYAPNNCYLLTEVDSALLIDTGFSVNQETIVAELESILGHRRMSIYLTRMGEFAGICNVRPIADRFHVDELHGVIDPHPAAKVDFRPEFGPSVAQGGGGCLRAVSESRSKVGDNVRVGNAGRVVNVLDAPLRLLPTRWLYDKSTKTLFTSDAFTWAWRHDIHGPWVVKVLDDADAESRIQEHLFGNRFWWLAGARTDDLRAAITGVVAQYDIERIAPSFGCVLEGSEIVGRHFDLLDRILAAAPAIEPLTVPERLRLWKPG